MAKITTTTKERRCDVCGYWGGEWLVFPDEDYVGLTREEKAARIEAEMATVRCDAHAEV